MNPYLTDILDQPHALRLALQKLELEPLEPIRGALGNGEIDRIVLTGMGASFYGMYPAWLLLAQAGLPAILVDAAELVHHTPGLVGERTLLWVASQSGRSVEIARLMDRLDDRSPAGWRPRGLLAITNEPDSPLGRAACASGDGMLRALLPIHAVPEETPSTRTYLNSLAISQLAALSLDPAAGLQTPASPAFAQLAGAADGIEAYLSSWEIALEAIGGVFSGQPMSVAPLTVGASHQAPPKIALLGRGASLASALTGALCLQEAAKIPALGFQAGEFRHGPLEIAGPDLTAWIFAGDGFAREGAAGETTRLNRKLWKDLRNLGVNAWLLESGAGGGSASDPRLPIPSASGVGLPLAEIVPVQLLCYFLCEQTGLTPGAFRHIGKVTLEE